MIKKQILLLLLLVGFCTSSLRAQSSYSSYTPIQIDETGAKQLKSIIERDVNAIVPKDIKPSTEEKALYASTVLELRELFKHGYISYNDTLSRYVNHIADKLSASREALRGKFKVYLYKNPESNAFTYTDGTILITTGMMARMTSESQIAFVLGHELGHLLKKHALQALEKEKELKKDFQTVGDINSLTLLMHYSQDFEMEADAVGIELMANAGYNTKEALKAVKNFTPYDTTNDYAPIDLKKAFSSDVFSVDSLMIHASKTKTTVTIRKDDKLSTHPNNDKRYIALREMMSALTVSNVQDSVSYRPVRYMARMENIMAMFLADDHIQSLYQCLRALNDYKDNTYLYMMAERNILWLANYSGNDVTKEISKDDDEFNGRHFMDLHHFLDKVSPNDLRKLSYSYIKSHYDDHKQDEDIAFYMAYAIDFYLGHGISHIYYNNYLKQFPNGRYAGVAQINLQ